MDSSRALIGGGVILAGVAAAIISWSLLHSSEDDPQSDAYDQEEDEQDTQQHENAAAGPADETAMAIAKLDEFRKIPLPEAVELIDSEDASDVLAALAITVEYCSFSQLKQAMLKCRVLPRVCKRIHSDSRLVKRAALEVIVHFAADNEHQQQLIRCGALLPLMELASTTDDAGLQRLALDVFVQMAVIDQGAQRCCDSGIATICARVCASPSSHLQCAIAAAKALVNMSCADELTSQQAASLVQAMGLVLKGKGLTKLNPLVSSRVLKAFSNMVQRETIRAAIVSQGQVAPLCQAFVAIGDAKQFVAERTEGFTANDIASAYSECLQHAGNALHVLCLAEPAARAEVEALQQHLHAIARADKS